MEKAQSDDASSSHLTAAAPADVADILKRLHVLTDESAAGRPSPESAADRFLALMLDPATCAACVAQLFPNGVPLDQTFFERLAELRHHFLFTNKGEEAIGIVWSEAMRGLSDENRQTLLRAFIGQMPDELIVSMAGLSTIVRDHALSAAFLAEWFVSLIQAVEHDYSAEGAWIAIRTMCMTRCDTALDILRLFQLSTQGTVVDIASFMLGVTRTLPLDGRQADAFRDIESFFRDHADAGVCAVFDWSWVATARERPLHFDEVEVLFGRAQRSPDDRNTVLSVMSRMQYCGKDLDGDVAHRTRGWISENVSPSISPEAKHHVAVAAQALAQRTGDGDGAAPELSGWLMGILPVPVENTGTWRAIGGYLAIAVKKSPSEFAVQFECLCEHEGAATAMQRLLQEKQLSWLHREMQSAGIDELVGRLCVSRRMETRRLGMYMFDSLGIRAFPVTALGSDAVAGRLLFYEAQRSRISPKANARILVAVAAVAEGTNDGFGDEVCKELKLQAHNFAGEFRTELTARGESIPIVKKALAEVADYFANLSRAHAAGIKGMEVTGYRHAVTEYARRFSRMVRKGAESNSPFLRMATKMTLLYGTNMSRYHEGTLSHSTPLFGSTVSQELPMVDLCDPEAMAMRRFHATAMIEQLCHIGSDEGRMDGETS
jgi:hypothetical protein